MIDPEFLDTEEVARLLGVGPRSVTEYLYRSRVLRSRNKPGRGTYGFPEPDKRYGGRAVWKPSTIEAWQRSRPRTGQLSKVG